MSTSAPRNAVHPTPTSFDGKPSHEPSDGTDFQIRRSEARLYSTPQGLAMLAGVPVERLRRMALKELTDNGLDAADRAGNSGAVWVREIRPTAM